MDITLDEIKEWLADKGTVENIQMRKGPQKTFKVRLPVLLTFLFPFIFLNYCKIQTSSPIAKGPVDFLYEGGDRNRFIHA